jgi:hypothetical protein
LKQGQKFEFVVDTGTTISLTSPTISKAQLRLSQVQDRGVSGMDLEILGVQKVTFKVGFQSGSMTFIHSFVVCLLDISSAVILGVDFLQGVGAGISLNDNMIVTNAFRF